MTLENARRSAHFRQGAKAAASDVIVVVATNHLLECVDEIIGRVVYEKINCLHADGGIAVDEQNAGKRLSDCRIGGVRPQGFEGAKPDQGTFVLLEGLQHHLTDIVAVATVAQEVDAFQAHAGVGRLAGSSEECSLDSFVLQATFDHALAGLFEHDLHCAIATALNGTDAH
jgi:hypothetical protein